MRSVRQKIRELTDRKWSWVKDIRVLIERLNPLLRGAKRKGRHLRPGEASTWTPAFFVEHHGLYRLLGTTQYPKAA